MRLKVGDPGSFDAVVLLDGVKQDCAVLADSDAGYVRRFKRDHNMQFVQAPDGELETEVVKGHVQIIIGDSTWAP